MYVGKPPPVAPLWTAQRSDLGRVAELRASRRAIGLAYEEREKLEVSFYVAEAKWMHAFEALRAADQDTHGVVAIRRARYELARADDDLRAAHDDLLHAHAALRALLTDRTGRA